MKVESPSIGIEKLCQKLGPAYSVRVIDCENVIYRDLGNGYDIEISGLDNNRKSVNATIYVWGTEPRAIVDTVKNVKSFEALVYILEGIASTYSSR